MVYVLYNSKACNGNIQEKLDGLKRLYESKEKRIEFKSVLEITDYKSFFDSINEDDDVIIAGGDGTLNRFVNNIEGLEIKNPLYSYAAGTGNDFLKDVKDKVLNGIVQINKYIKDLPIVTVNGKEYRYLNNVGFGIDGYCCEVGDKLLLESDKPVNYTSVAIKGLLFHFHPANAKITVDGVTKEYKKVWLAPTMNGRYYGGGMMITPDQDRLNEDRLVSCAVFYGTGKIRTLMIFPKIFTGGHVKYTKHLDFMQGHEIKVEFDRPTALQVDGETFTNITEYTVRSGKGLKLKKDEKKLENV